MTTPERKEEKEPRQLFLCTGSSIGPIPIPRNEWEVYRSHPAAIYGPATFAIRVNTYRALLAFGGKES